MARKKSNLSGLGTIDFRRRRKKPRGPRGKFVQEFRLSWNELKDLKLGFTLKGIAFLQWGAEALREYPKYGKYAIRNKKYKVFVRAATKYPDDRLRRMLDLIDKTMQYKDVHWKGRVY